MIYKPVSGKKQNVHTKQFLRDENIIEERKNYNVDIPHNKNDIANSEDSGIIEIDKNTLSKYIGKPIIETDNQHIREWYYANVSDIPNQIDKSKPFEQQVKQAFELRNKYKHEARVAMSDTETASILEKKRPAPTFDRLLKDKMERKQLTKNEALEDILKTASKTNSDVNKEFGL